MVIYWPASWLLKMVCCDLLACKNFWEIQYCRITKLLVLQARNLEKVQLVPFSLANGRKSHAVLQKSELLIPFHNIYLVSLKQLHCQGAHVVTCFFQSKEIVTFVYLSRYSWKLFHFHILRAPLFSEFNNLLFVIDIRNMTNSHSNTVVYFFT